jgi:gamma-glutamyltranspeptidase/glutathione hydrolase
MGASLSTTSGWAIASPHDLATQASVRAFEAGGNAIDAALAAAAVLTVVYPHNCALGGDLFALVRDGAGATVSVNGSGPAARATDPDALRRLGATMPADGPATVTVPGLVAGWQRIHEVGARLSWRDALAGARALAYDGAPVADSLAAAIAEAGVLEDPGMAAVLAPDGVPLKAGERLRQPALGATLGRLADGGAREFYEGDVAARLLAGLRGRGSLLDRDDLGGFHASVEPALRLDRQGTAVLTSPPNSSGVVLLQALAVLDATGLSDPLGVDAGTLAEIFRAVGEDRDRMLGDPRDSDVAAEAWIGGSRVQAIARRVLAEAREPGAAPAVPPPGGDTVAVVAADGSGCAVSLIQSLFHPFGAGILEPVTGVLVHNRGSMFSLTPGHPNETRPGRRPSHTLTPVLVERDGRLQGALGTMGGRVQAQILVHVLVRLLAGDRPQQAVDAPRWIAGPLAPGEGDDVVRIEAGTAEATRSSLARSGLRPHLVPRHNRRLGHAQAVWVEDGCLHAGSDRRADGRAATSHGGPGA